MTEGDIPISAEIPDLEGEIFSEDSERQASEKTKGYLQLSKSLAERNSFREEEQKIAHKNKIGVLQHSGILVIVALWLFSLAFAFTFCIWLWHFLASSSYGWLNGDQLSKIQTLIFSGTLGAVASSVIQRYFVNRT